MESNNFNALCKQFFHNIEKWITQPITNENKNSPLATWIYRCVGFLVNKCSTILYNQVLIKIFNNKKLKYSP